MIYHGCLVKTLVGNISEHNLTAKKGVERLKESRKRTSREILLSARKKTNGGENREEP